LNKLRNNIYNIYEKKLRFEHHLKLFETHIQNNTVPSALHHKKLPVPFLWDDIISVDSYNVRIKEFQTNVMKDNVSRLKALIKTKENDLKELKDSLVDYPGNKENFFNNAQAAANNDLKPFFDAGNNKLLRMNANLFEDHILNEYENNDAIGLDHFNHYMELAPNEESSYKPKNNATSKASNKPKKGNNNGAKLAQSNTVSNSQTISNDSSTILNNNQTSCPNIPNNSINNTTSTNSLNSSNDTPSNVSSRQNQQQQRRGRGNFRVRGRQNQHR
jgi:hypothetical protein